MPQAQENSKVKVHYTGKLEDGTVFDTSREREPLEFQIGQGQIIPGFEKAVVGMETGESKTATIPADDAYGERREDLVTNLSKDELPDDLEPEVGQMLHAQDSQGQTIPVQVTEVNDEGITIDANHPLAGKDLTFEIELVEVEK